jgi:hypothetical protein
MPPLKATRLQHIQDVRSGRKKALLQRNVPARHVPRWPELAVKIIYPQVINTYPALQEYLPDPQGKDDIRLPDRDFFYRVMYALYPDMVEDLVRQAAAARKPAEKNLQEEQWTLAISPEWMEQLLRHDYTSCKYPLPNSFVSSILIADLIGKKGKGFSSLLIS